jgi:hypothetical protein
MTDQLAVRFFSPASAPAAVVSFGQYGCAIGRSARHQLGVGALGQVPCLVTAQTATRTSRSQRIRSIAPPWMPSRRREPVAIVG